MSKYWRREPDLVFVYSTHQFKHEQTEEEREKTDRFYNLRGKGLQA